VTTISQVRRIRNQLVHGIEIPNRTYLDKATSNIQTVLSELESHQDAAVKAAYDEASHVISEHFSHRRRADVRLGYRWDRSQTKCLAILVAPVGPREPARRRLTACSHVETRRLPEARWQRRVVVR
jgi:hypothetical protein